MAIDVRPCADHDEFSRAVGAIGQYFSPPPSPEMLERFARLLPRERMHAAFDDGEVVGGAGAFPFVVSVPGGELPCAGVTVVGVHPTHRRRGVLRAMMDAQLRDVHERGEPLAALWASEETIYGRFGYGLGSWVGEVRIPKPRNAFAQPLERRGTTRFVTPDEAKELFPPVFEAVRRQRPGMHARSAEWWALRQLRMPDEEASSPRRFVVVELDGGVQAYAVYRTFFAFEEGSSASRVVVNEALGATPQATAEIWRFLLDIDWMETVEASLLPPDHPLFLLLATPRRIRYRMGDGLWVRVVDVAAALSGRAYGGDEPLVLAVRDAVCAWNEGRWLLEGGACSRTDADADLVLDASALGAAYLGAVSFAQLRDALRVEELRDGAVARADRLFAWRPLPWSPEIF
ncbi:MAG TPA: GNAT family N-acetyltransferase [Gaiellaceae bacterium]|nr:GNAT family N-acetyltransferase [Gaiellaceae bacterium]